MTGGSARPQVVYFGMFGALSRVPLAALLAAGVDVRAVLVPPAGAPGAATGPRRLPPPPGWGTGSPSPAALARRTIVDLAWERDLPVLEVARLDEPAVLMVLEECGAEIVVVSCFPARLPPALLALPPLGCLNLHPSLLPRNRGPAPLFWTFREGWQQGGATVHLMDRGLDSGPIVAQADFDLSDGLTERELELRCAALGAELLVRAARDLAAGTATPTPQDEARATVHPWPGASDFVVTPDRPARWAYNFIRGTAGWGHPHLLVLDGARVVVRAARAYDPDARLDTPFEHRGDELRVQCSPGVLTVTTVTSG